MPFRTWNRLINLLEGESDRISVARISRSNVTRDLPLRSDLASPNARRAIGRNDRPDSPSFDICGTNGALVCQPVFRTAPHR